ncbi:hypothetical protein SLEP1_g53238 [Rubroshorea leprosula]|uniref:Uncharacterized protein n=1 Tax=Rubroshorea leprosula TaxID=152421 RepID=A0AAV5MB62_9ROSI|nr:hypothetical protein SLEP1_g53238 [Rubroshorea leprosula]
MSESTSFASALEDTTSWRDDILFKVKGSDKKGRVCCLGKVPTFMWLSLQLKGPCLLRSLPSPIAEKKLKSQYPEVDVMKITFGKQEERVKEDGEIKEGKAEAVGTEVEKSQPPPPVEIHPVPLEEE